MELEALFIICAFLIEIIATVSGFGTSALLLPFAFIFFDFRSALAVVAVFHIFSGIVRILLFRCELDLKILIGMGIPGMALSFLGALVATTIPMGIAKSMVAIFLIAFTAFSALARGFRIKDGPSERAAGGGIAGFLAGAAGIGGAPLSAIMISMRLPNKKYIATSAAIMLAINLVRAPVYFASGFLDSPGIAFFATLFAVALAAGLLGKKLHSAIPPKISYIVAEILIAIVSLYILSTVIWG